jgi:hypothetical protein
MKKFFKIIGGIIGGIIVLGIIAGIVGGNSSSDTSSSKPTTSKPTAPVTAPATSDSNAELQAMLKSAPAPVVKKDDMSMEVTYTLTNNTKDKFDYVELDVDFYNKAGVKIGSEMTNTENVTAGQKFQLDVGVIFFWIFFYWYRQ